MQKRTQQRFITKLSNKYNIDSKIIEVICNHPFVFTAQKMRENDPKPIRFMYLGKFKMKKNYEQKADKTKENTK